MRFLLVTAAAAVTVLAPGRAAQMPAAPPATDKPLQVATACFKKGEEVSGMNKICYYDCLGSLTAITIKSIQICPLSINR